MLDIIGGRGGSRALARVFKTRASAAERSRPHGALDG
jgi:hypothetical protein